MRRKRNVMGFMALVLIHLVGCSAQQLAKDEAAALAAFQKADALITSGAAGSALQVGADELLNSDPDSPTVQRAAALMRQASTPKAQFEAHIALQGGIVLMQTKPAQ